MLNCIYAGGPDLIKNRPGVRFAAAAAVFSVIGTSPPAGNRNCKGKAKAVAPAA